MSPSDAPTNPLSLDKPITFTVEPNDAGGFTVTSPQIPPLLTEAKTVPEALRSAADAFEAIQSYNQATKPGAAVDLKDRPKHVEAANYL